MSKVRTSLPACAATATGSRTSASPATCCSRWSTPSTRSGAGSSMPPAWACGPSPMTTRSVSATRCIRRNPSCAAMRRSCSCVADGRPPLHMCERISMHTASNPSRGEWRGWLLGGVALAAIVGTLLVPRIPQDESYHLFADTRTIAGIPNFWNVISNAPFALVGIYGLTLTPRLARSLWPGYIAFCIAVIGVCIGSAYYHYAPSTPALVWDRLPMSIAFMAVFTLILGDRVNPALGRTLLAPLLIIGAASVFYWSWTERHGVGDLRPYALVQFLPLVLIVVMLWLYPGSRESTAWLWWSFLMYFLAKVAERFDAPIYHAVGFSGHSMKHLLSAAAILFALFALLRLPSRQTRGAALELSRAAPSPNNQRRTRHD